MGHEISSVIWISARCCSQWSMNCVPQMAGHQGSPSDGGLFMVMLMVLIVASNRIYHS